MPAKDRYHEAVRCALIKDGWTITHDPSTIGYGGRERYVDLGAERSVIAAEKDQQKIAVEIKSFLSPSPIHDLEDAVGQYDVYRSVLAETEPERFLYLAVPIRAYEGIFAERFGQLLLARLHLCLVVFEPQQEEVVQWVR